MSESAYKPADAFEDELDQLAHSIRDELRQIGFAPAFDPLPEEVLKARRVEESLKRRRARARHLILSYIALALLVVAVGIVVRLFVPIG